MKGIIAVTVVSLALASIGCGPDGSEAGDESQRPEASEEKGVDQIWASADAEDATDGERNLSSQMLDESAAGCTGAQLTQAQKHSDSKRSCSTVTSCDYNANTGYIVYSYTIDNSLFSPCSMFFIGPF